MASTRHNTSCTEVKINLKEFRVVKDPNHKSELVSHLNIDISEIFDTQTWTPKHRCDQVLVSSKHHLPVVCITCISCFLSGDFKLIHSMFSMDYLLYM